MKHQLKYKPYVLLLFFSLIFFSCENDEIEDYIQRDASVTNLVGTWVIQSVEANGNVAKVPINYKECGADFFTYSANGIYEETAFNSSQCFGNKNKLDWELMNGVIQLSNSLGESQKIEIRKLNRDVFIFQVNLDLDKNPGTEMYIFTATRYTPPKESDLYTDTFHQKYSNELIEFKWEKYQGFNAFQKYEIFRTDGACNSASAKLIKTITNVNENSFIDLKAFSTKHCYFLKIYTDKGLLGESSSREITTIDLMPSYVNIENATVNNETVSISWQKSSDPYFSHYEIRYYDTVDFTPNYYHQVTTIENINTTHYIDTDPPYLIRPVYAVLVHNKFGNVNYVKKDENTISVDIIRKGMLDIDYLYKMVFDKEDQSFIFYYRESTYGDYKFAKYNCLEKKIVADSYKQPNYSTGTSMKITNSETGFGKEFIYPQSDELWVYNAEDLTYKYAFNLDNTSTSSFTYLANNIWITADDDNVFAYKRNNDSFTLLDKKPHFPQHQGTSSYEILKIDSNTILVSHNNEGRAILYTIGDSGNITNNGFKNIPLQYNYSQNNSIQYNANSSYILSTQNNRIYNSTDYTLVKQFTYPLISSSLSLNGKKVYGTNNLRERTDGYKTAKREIIIYDIETGSLETKPTKGYPLFVTEDNKGNIICLSANFPGETFNNFQSRLKNLFIEVIKK